MNPLPVHLQNGDAPLEIGQFHRHPPVKPARAQQGRVQGLRPVGGGQKDDALAGVKAVHLGQQLVEGLLPLVVAAQAAGVPLLADGVDLVDEHDAGGLLPRLLEQIPHLGRPHAHEHLHKFRAGDGEEGHLGLPGHRLGQQGLAGARRPHQQHALGQAGADGGVLLRPVEEVHHLHQRLLGLVLAGHVGKGYAGGRLLHVDLGPRLAEGHGVAHPAGQAAHALHHPAGEQLPNDDKDHNGKNPAHQEGENGVGLGGDLRSKGDPLLRLELGQQPLAVIRPDAGLVIALPAAVVLRNEYDLPARLIQSHLLHLAAVHHGQKLAVRHLHHLALQQGREEKHVQQHQHNQRRQIVEDQRLFGGRSLYLTVLQFFQIKIPPRFETLFWVRRNHRRSPSKSQRAHGAIYILFTKEAPSSRTEPLLFNICSPYRQSAGWAPATSTGTPAGWRRTGRRRSIQR